MEYQSTLKMDKSILGKEKQPMEKSQLRSEESIKQKEENLFLMQTGERKQKNECLNGEQNKKSVRVPSYVTPDTITEIKPEDKSIRIDKETFNSFREWFKTTKERDYQRYILIAKEMKEKQKYKTI
jgi:hypothetical protein